MNYEPSIFYLMKFILYIFILVKGVIQYIFYISYNKAFCVNVNRLIFFMQNTFHCRVVLLFFSLFQSCIQINQCLIHLKYNGCNTNRHLIQIMVCA